MKKTHILPSKKVSAGERQLRVLFNNTNEHGICMLNSKGCITTWNESAERLMGYSAQEVIGKEYAHFFSPDEVARGIPRKALAVALKKGSVIAEGVRLRKDGSHFWARSYLTLVNEGSTSINFFVLITQDISERRAQDLRRDEYIGIASHELKTPITTLSLYSELLAKRLVLDNDKKNLQMMRDIQSQAARLVSLVDDLLVVSKIEGGHLVLHKEMFLLDALVSKILNDMRMGSSRHVLQYVGPKGVQVYADKDRIAQVLVNILNNAVKYSPHDTTVRVKAELVKGVCMVSIRNYGPVIKLADQRDIFTRYFRSDEAAAGSVSGSGLGLYISKQIMLKHREQLSVTSTKKDGTTFRFTLPTA